MTRIETEVYKQAANDLIGLRVIVIDNQERPINNIIVVQPEDLIRIENDLITHNHDETYVSIESVSARIREIAQELFTDIARQDYRPPTFYVEDDGDFYVEYHEGELVVHDNIEIDLESRHITTYNGDYTITGLVTNNDEPLLNRDILLYNINDTSEHYFAKTDLHGVITFNQTIDVPTKTYRMSTSGTFTDIEVIYTKYDIENEVGTIANEQGEATISAVLKNWNNTVEGQTIELLLNDTVVDSDVTDENGEVNFDVTVEETTWYELKFTKPNNEEIKKDFGVQHHPWKTYNFKFDGTEPVVKTNYSGLQFINENDENIMTRGAGYINIEFPNIRWTFECDLKITKSYNGLILRTNEGNNSMGSFDAVRVTKHYDNIVHYACVYNDNSYNDTVLNNDFNDWVHIILTKNDDYNIQVEIDNEIVGNITYLNNGSVGNIYLGIHNTSGDANYTYIKNASITYLQINPVLKETYHPLLDGTEEMTTITTRTPVIHDNEMDGYMQSCSGYLTQGFKNTQYWQVKIDVRRSNGTGSDSCGPMITKKGRPTGDNSNYSLMYRNSGTIISYGNNTEQESGAQKNRSWSDQWITIIYTKISSKIVLVEAEGSNKISRIVWPTLASCEYLCIGCRQWSNPNTVSIRNIHVKTSLENI